MIDCSTSSPWNMQLTYRHQCDFSLSVCAITEVCRVLLKGGRKPAREFADVKLQDQLGSLNLVGLLREMRCIVEIKTLARRQQAFPQYDDTFIRINRYLEKIFQRLPTGY